MDSKLRDTIEATTREFLQSYEDATAKQDPALIEATLSQDCIHHLVPASFLKALGADPDTEFSNEMYRAGFQIEMGTWFATKCEVTNLTIDTTARRSACRGKAHVTFSDGDEMDMDFAWFFEFVDDGTKISRVTEYCDAIDGVKHAEKARGLKTTSS